MRFFVLEYRKRHFPGVYCPPSPSKKLEKCPFLDENDELAPMKKCQFLSFRTSCFYSLERRFFCSRIS